MSKSMQHWNGCQMCVIDTETTGLDPHWQEIIQICILPLDSDLKPRKDVNVFYMEMKPEFPERASPEAFRVNKLDAAKIMSRGMDQEKAKDLLDDWINKLDLPLNKGGINRCKIIPLGHNYAFDMGFLKRWLGIDQYNEYFHYHFRDSMSAAAYLNDRAAVHAEKIPYPKVNLQYLCSCLKIETERAHDALQDCLATAEVYRLLVNQGLLA